MTSSYFSKQNGFTTIEMLTAIILFAILVPTIIGFINVIASLNDRARDVSIINSVVENKVEEIRSNGFRSVDTGTYDFSHELPNTISIPRSATMVITELEPNLKEIHIIASYTSRGSNNTVEYKTYLGEIGVGQY